MPTSRGYAPALIKPFFSGAQLRSTLDVIKAAVGYIPVGGFDTDRSPFAFGPKGVGRTNLTGNARLNGYSFSVSRTDLGDYASTDVLSAGLYEFSWVITQINPTLDAVEMFIYDRGDNVVARFNVFLVQGGPPAGTNATNRMNIPVAEGQRVALRRTASNGNGMVVAMSWTFLNPYLGNTPLSLAPVGVQRTEGISVLSDTQSAATAAPEPGSIIAGGGFGGYVGGDGGGDGGGGSGDGGGDE